jgi:branched-subunit amino acid transport protein
MAVLYRFREFCARLEPITIFASSFLITEFYSRIAAGFRSRYGTLVQHPSLFSCAVTFLPPVISLVFAAGTDDQVLRQVFTFSSIFSLLAIAFPFVLGQTGLILGQFVHIVLLFAALTCWSGSFVWFFALAIPTAFLQFPNERSPTDNLRAIVVAPLLSLFFAGLIGADEYRKNLDRRWVTATSIAGCILAILLDKQ